jgi:hypothetical protein
MPLQLCHVFAEILILRTARGAGVYEVTRDSACQTVWHLHVDAQFAYRAFRLPSLSRRAVVMMQFKRCAGAPT